MVRVKPPSPITPSLGHPITHHLLRRGLGMLAGLAASIAATRLLRGLFFGVGPQDPITLAAVCGVLFSAALAAFYLPARWASRLDPAQTLRSE